MSRQRHPEGLVGKLWRIVTPATVRIGDCFLRGRLLKGDLFLGVEHAGDCFQNYAYVKEYANKWVLTEHRFGSYGIGDAIHVPITPEQLEGLLYKGFFNISEWWKHES
jgi:hypothetical protein